MTGDPAEVKRTGGYISIRSALTDNPLIRHWKTATSPIDVIDADAPWRIDGRTWLKIAARTLDGAMRDDYGIVASSIAFAAFLSILPVLSLIALIYGMVVSGSVVRADIATLTSVLPHNAQHLVGSWLINSLTRHEGGATALMLSAAITVFGARRAGSSLLYGLNVATGIEQDRGPIATRLVSVAVVVAGAGLMLAALVAISALAVIRSLISSQLPGISTLFQILLWGSLTLGPAAALTLTYRYAPARKPAPWLWAVPGALAAVLLWIGATLSFRIYVSRVASYSSTYGSLSAVIVLLLWLMLSAYIMLFGAKLNTEAMAAAGLRQG